MCAQRASLFLDELFEKLKSHEKYGTTGLNKSEMKAVLDEVMGSYAGKIGSDILENVNLELEEVNASLDALEGKELKA